MFHKILTVFVLLFAACALYAQKPVAAAVTDIEDDPSNGLEMCRSLFNEYFLSELTTHAKVNMLDTASTQKTIAKQKLSRGKTLSAKQISDLCKSLKTDALCLLKMSRRGKEAINITVRIVDLNGKERGVAKASMKGIGDTDATSNELARKSAVILRRIRGINEAESQKMEKQSQPQALPSTVTEI